MRHSILISTALSLVSLSFYLHASGLVVADFAALSNTSIQQSATFETATHSISLLQDMPVDSCMPFCVNPVALSEGVSTVDELAVIQFMESSQHKGEGLLIDARSPSWHQRGTIPGSLNIPASVFERAANNAELATVLKNFGAEPRHDVSMLRRAFEVLGLLNGKMKTAHWDFSQAQPLVLWCNDPWCGQSPRAIKALLSLGYPAEKLHYYRGGLQTWESLGLVTVMPSDNRLATNE